MRLGLLVRITDTARNTRVQRTFADLPVRIGRNPLNDLQLTDNHVSQFHAVVESHQGALMLRDLGSRNGTRVASRRAPAHEPIPLEPEHHTFFIASLKFELAMGPVEVQGPRRFVVGAAPMNALTQTRLLDQPAMPATKTVVFDGGPAPGPPPGLAALGATVALNPEVEAKPLDPAERQRRLEAVALQAVRELATALLPSRRIDSPEDVVGFLSHVRDTVDVFTRCFVPLRDGYRAFTTQMTLEATARGSSPEMNERQLAEALLDWTSPDYGSGQRAIEGTFADLMIHQLALLNGIMRGVKALLQQLSPTAIDRALGELASQGKTGFAWGPWRFRELWRVYATRYGDVDDGDKRTFAALFGREFAEAYGQFRKTASDQAEVQEPR